MSTNWEEKVDKAFGIFLRRKRVTQGLDLKDAAKKTGINHNRLKTIESGTVNIGIRKTECARLAVLYGIPESEMRRAASGEQA